MGVARFWREISQRYNLIGNKCEVCGQVFFPPRESCPQCRRKSMGKIKDQKLSEGPRITAQIVDCDIDDVKIGMKVESVFRKIQQDGSTGAIYYGYKFKKRN